MGAVIFERSGSVATSGTNLTTLTHTHFTYGGANTVVIGAGFCQLGDTYPGTPTGLTHTMSFGASAMTSLGTVALNNLASGGGFVELFYLFNPPSGSQTVTTTYSPGTGNYLAGVTCSYQNVASLSAITTAYGPGPTQSVTVSGGATDSVAVMVLGNYQYFTPVNGTRASSGLNGAPVIIADSILNSSNVFSNTQTVATRVWGAIGVALQPVPSTKLFSMK